MTIPMRIFHKPFRLWTGGAPPIYTYWGEYQHHIYVFNNWGCLTCAVRPKQWWNISAVCTGGYDSPPLDGPRLLTPWKSCHGATGDMGWSSHCDETMRWSSDPGYSMSINDLKHLDLVDHYLLRICYQIINSFWYAMWVQYLRLDRVSMCNVRAKAVGILSHVLYRGVL